jgi:DNA replication protein DnaC
VSQQRWHTGTLAAALADLLGQSMPAFERRLRHYTTPDLLVLDELGCSPCDTRAGDILYNVIRRRHEQRSTIITMQLLLRKTYRWDRGGACNRGVLSA